MCSCFASTVLLFLDKCSTWETSSMSKWSSCHFTTIPSNCIKWPSLLPTVLQSKTVQDNPNRERRRLQVNPNLSEGIVYKCQKLVAGSTGLCTNFAPALSLLMSFACILEPWIYPAQQKPQLCQPTQTLLPRSHPKPFLLNPPNGLTVNAMSSDCRSTLACHESKSCSSLSVSSMWCQVSYCLAMNLFQVIWSSLDTTKGGVHESRHCMTEQAKTI